MAKKDKVKKDSHVVDTTIENEISMDDFKDVSVMNDADVPAAEPQPYIYKTSKEVDKNDIAVESEEKNDVFQESVKEDIAEPVKESNGADSNVTEEVDTDKPTSPLINARRKKNQRRIIRVHSANFSGWCHND